LSNGSNKDARTLAKMPKRLIVEIERQRHRLCGWADGSGLGRLFHGFCQLNYPIGYWE
jgi:hypothetical protein